ncbi:MAG TPA: sensor histidine kinase [Rhizomicrobium sp.]|jgi:two-component sensor histidine kinase|nr:sensor histidine kinase [Rhizomicrobium sp.]
MQQSLSSPSPRTPPHTPWLLVEEIEHRVANEFSMAMSSISLAAARSSSPEVKAALAGTARRLQDFACVHRSLQPPRAGALVNLSDYLEQLCESLVRARLKERGIRLTLVTQDMEIAPERCWRVGLILSELITNSVRHAFLSPGGTIAVEIQSAEGVVQCLVSDNGRSTAGASPGRGTRIVDALAGELGGSVWREFNSEGTTVLLMFPETVACISSSIQDA